MHTIKQKNALRRAAGRTEPATRATGADRAQLARRESRPFADRLLALLRGLRVRFGK